MGLRVGTIPCLTITVPATAICASLNSTYAAPLAQSIQHWTCMRQTLCKCVFWLSVQDARRGWGWSADNKEMKVFGVVVQMNREIDGCCLIIHL